MEAALMPSVLDMLVAGVLPILAWRILATDDVHEAVVLFIALGLLAAVAWARLDAPDIALVEAAVGTGITGALLVGTVRAIGPEPSTSHRAPSIALAVLAFAGALGIATTLTTLPATDPGLGDMVRASVPQTGVGNPVTAVLLDIRSYDTLLEMAVLVVAVLAVRSRAADVALRDDDPTRPIMAVLVRALLPGLVLVAGYLLWRGAAAPGGAFQAAAVLAGGGILAILAGTIRSPDPYSRWVRGGLVFGPSVFLAIAAFPLLVGAHVLEYPDGWGKTLIFAIELALTFSIALVLVLFFPGSPRRPNPVGELG
jgi:multisubunit Na+/H+ antiporter MnhB subunit